ncbi:aminotransferase class V-fold PLP-dependent enzyme [Elongatibacter sediminis]|uniref:Aminotransferase class V-fold PLP-dependent enzyme n=1 Tax=Elongatibacter sediminis TaxID=3119006 RepID=A0AAW9R6X8_9GAMM
MNPLDSHIDDIRAQFKMLDHWVYLNAGDIMVPGNYWLDAARDYYRFQECGRMEDIPTADAATHPFLTPAWQECIERGARLINAQPDEVTNMYRPAITANLILYNMFEWHDGDNVVITDLSYPAIPYILQDIARRHGVEIRVVRHVEGEVPLEKMESAIDGRTRLVAVDRTAAFSGFTFDMKSLCRLAHDQGAVVLDDAMQALGAIDIDVADDEVDLLISGSYKWQCGPEGAGLFYIRRAFMDTVDARFRNYIWADVPGGIPFADPHHDNLASWDHPPVNNANRFSQDTVIGPSLFGWNATLKFYERHGIGNIEERVRRLGTYATERLQDIGCTVTSPLDPERRHGLITYTNGDYDRDLEFFRRCAAPGRCKKPIRISMRALGGVGNLRVCTHFFNTEEDIDTLVDLQASMR